MALVTTIALPAENGVAPYIGSLGYGTNSFSGFPLPGGVSSAVSAVDTVARWGMTPPAVGAVLVAWGLSDEQQPGSAGVPGTRLYDFSTPELNSADFAIVLVDSSDLFVAPSSIAYSGDMVDYSLTSIFPVDTASLQLRTDDSDEQIGYFEATLDGTDDGIGYHVEVLAFAFSGSVQLNTSVIYLTWETEVVANGWQVGTVGFAGQTAGFA